MQNRTATAERPAAMAPSSSVEAPSQSSLEDPGQAFIDWVLGYGYAAGHIPERPRTAQGQGPAAETGPEPRA